MDPSSEFAVSIAVGAAHVLGSVLDSLGRATRSPVAAALLALPVLAAYLAAVTLAFAVRAAADCYACIVVACGVDVAQKAAPAVLEWLVDLVVRVAVPALLFISIALAVACALVQFA